MGNRSKQLPAEIVKAAVAGALGHAWRRIGRYARLTLPGCLILDVPIIVILLVFLLASPLLALHPDAAANPRLAFLVVPVVILFVPGALVDSISMSLRLPLAFSVYVQ
jgi:hypothetical protein